MWFAAAFIGIIAIATGITVLPGGEPQKSPPTATAPASPAATPPAASGTSR